MTERKTPHSDPRDYESLARLEDWQLEDKALDLRGQTLHNRSGRPLGRISDMLVDVDQERVAALRLDDGFIVDIDDVDISDGRAMLMTAASPAQAPDAPPPPRHAAETGYRDAAQDRRGSDDQRVPIVEEQLDVGKRVTDLRNVSVRTRVVERPVSEEVTLRRERVEVERRPADRSLTAAEADALLKDQIIELTERGEEAVVRKTARVVEEVVVRKGVERHTKRVEDSVRHTEIDVDRDGTMDRDDRRR